MLKGLIWFSDIDLYNKCEIEARRLGISCAADYISFQVEKYLEESDPKYAPQKIISKKSGDEKEKKYFRNSVDVWLAVKDQADKQNISVASLMEQICRNILCPAENKPVNNYPVSDPSTRFPAVEQEKRTGVLSKIGDAISLPRG